MTFRAVSAGVECTERTRNAAVFVVRVRAVTSVTLAVFRGYRPRG